MHLGATCLFCLRQVNARVLSCETLKIKKLAPLGMEIFCLFIISIYVSDNARAFDYLTKMVAAGI